MKVCTDACVLGAFADVNADRAGASSVDGGGISDNRILDIGTGTGLLALMAAQRNPMATIDAVEVDEAAFDQATQNVLASPFASRITVSKGRIQDYQSTEQYDRILTNPPFYTNHLKSPDLAVNRALHTDELPFIELIEVVARLMKPDGQWWVLLPPYEMERLTVLAGQVGLYTRQRLLVKHNAQKPNFRVISAFTFEKRTIQEETLVIFEPVGPVNSAQNRPKETYTSQFRTLLCDFYLIF